MTASVFLFSNTSVRSGNIATPANGISSCLSSRSHFPHSAPPSPHLPTRIHFLNLVDPANVDLLR